MVLGSAKGKWWSVAAQANIQRRTAESHGESTVHRLCLLAFHGRATEPLKKAIQYISNANAQTMKKKLRCIYWLGKEVVGISYGFVCTPYVTGTNLVGSHVPIVVCRKLQSISWSR
jgi:hypothetical protein